MFGHVRICLNHVSGTIGKLCIGQHTGRADFRYRVGVVRMVRLNALVKATSES